MRKVRIAQIGVNRYSHAIEIIDTLTGLQDIFEFVGYALVEDERETCAKKIEKHYSMHREMTLEEILNDPTIEAVAVETDEIHLLKYAQMVADAGKHIHMEKPGSQDLTAFEHLIETVKKNKTILNMGYMYRHNPFVKETLKRVRSGELGHIFSVEGHMSRLDTKEEREWMATFKGGMMFYLGCHLIDLVMLIKGTPTNVIPLNTATGIDGVDSEDFGFAVLQYPGATAFVRVSATEVGGGHRRQLVVCGEYGTVEIRPLECPTDTHAMLTSEKHESLTDVTKSRTGVFSQKYEHVACEPFHRYRDMMHDFAAMVRGEMENPYTLDYELALFKVIMQCCGFEIGGLHADTTV